jgi:hypothetical protein
MEDGMKNLVSLWITLFFFAGAVNCLAMGGGEPQRPADERGMQERVDTEPARDPQQPPRTQEWYQEQEQPGWDPDQQQQEDGQTPKEFFGIGQEQEGEQEQPQQSFNGILDRAGEEWVLVIGNRAYLLEVEDEQQVQGLMGRQVEVWGNMEEDIIEVDTVMRAGVILEQPETERPPQNRSE